MSKPFPYWLRLSIVTSLSVLLSFNPAFAGRMIYRASNAHYGCRVVECCVPTTPCHQPVIVSSMSCGCSTMSSVVPSYGATNSDCGGCGSVAAPGTSDCGCGSTVMSEMVIPQGHVEHSIPSNPPIVLETPRVTPSPGDQPNVEPARPSEANVAPAARDLPPVESVVAPSPFEPAPSEPARATPEISSAAEPLTSPDPASIPEPAPAQDQVKSNSLNDLFAPSNSPAPSEAANNTPTTNDLFAPSDTDAASKPATNTEDLFAPRPAEVPQPIEPAAASVDSLFPTTPADEPAMKPIEPATTNIDDLFGPTPGTEPKTLETAAPTPTDDLFAPAPFNTAPQPAPIEPTNPLDDLFSPPADNTPKPTTPAPANDLDDLFKPSSSERKSNPLFNGTKPVSTDVEFDNKFDDLFTQPKVDSNHAATESNLDKSSDSSPAKADSKNSENTRDSIGDELDKLFKSTSIPTDKEFNGAEFREWIDNTGDYKVKARLAVIYSDRVRLMKENGKFTTVPLSRLSKADWDYVGWVALNLSKGPEAKFVNTELDPGSSNSEVAR